MTVAGIPSGRAVARRYFLPLREIALVLARNRLISPATRTGQGFVGIKDTRSPECFFAILAAFFSFGFNKGCFLDSLLDFSRLDMAIISGSK